MCKGEARPYVQVVEQFEHAEQPAHGMAQGRDHEAELAPDAAGLVADLDQRGDAGRAAVDNPAHVEDDFVCRVHKLTQSDSETMLGIGGPCRGS